MNVSSVKLHSDQIKHCGEKHHSSHLSVAAGVLPAGPPKQLTGSGQFMSSFYLKVSQLCWLLKQLLIYVVSAGKISKAHNALKFLSSWMPDDEGMMLCYWMDKTRCWEKLAFQFTTPDTRLVEDEMWPRLERTGQVAAVQKAAVRLDSFPATFGPCRKSLKHILFDYILFWKTF